MSKTRRNHAPQFKAKVALEALAGEKTIHEIAAKHQVHPNQVTQWRRQLIDQAASVFGKGQATADPTGDREALLAKIGQLTVEKDFLARVRRRDPCRADRTGRTPPSRTACHPPVRTARGGAVHGLLPSQAPGLRGRSRAHAPPR